MILKCYKWNDFISEFIALTESKIQLLVNLVKLKGEIIPQTPHTPLNL